MSYTPMEVLTQRQGIRTAKGRVVISGLGMGWLANRVAQKPSVKEVVVIELEPDVIELAKPACANPKISIIRGDCWEHTGKFDDSWVFLFDIWKNYGRANWDKNLKEFRYVRPKAKVWSWGSFYER